MSDVYSILPREIIEQILSYCDGNTLMSAREVNPDWKEIIDYLSEKQNIWKNCCKNDIPHKDLLQYQNKWTCKFTNPIEWQHLYINWFSSNDMKRNICLKSVKLKISKKHSLGQIKSIVACGEYIAVANQNNYIMVFNQTGDLIERFKFDTRISSIYFVLDDEQHPSGILLQSECGVFIRNLKNCNDLHSFPEHRALSSFKNRFFSIRNNSFINIAQVMINNTNESMSVKTIATLNVSSGILLDSLYCSQYQVSNMVSESQIVLLIDTKIIVLTFLDIMQWSIIDRGMLQLCRIDTSMFEQNVWLLTNEVVLISTKEGSSRRQDMELFIYGSDKTYRKKVIWPQSTFGARITSVFLYGSILILGTNDSFLYFYKISDWNRFDIEQYSKSIEVYVAFGPIQSIDVTESVEGRYIYCTSAWGKICRISATFISHY